MTMAALYGCAGASPNNSHLRESTWELQYYDPDDLILAELDPERSKSIVYRLGKPAEQLDQIESALTGGYAKLVTDIENGEYACIGKQDIARYQGSDWTYRTIGYPNWIKSLRGHLLLEKARSLKYQIVLLGLLNGETDDMLIRQKEEELRALVDRLTVLTQDQEWRE